MSHNNKNTRLPCVSDGKPPRAGKNTTVVNPRDEPTTSSLDSRRNSSATKNSGAKPKASTLSGSSVGSSDGILTRRMVKKQNNTGCTKQVLAGELDENSPSVSGLSVGGMGDAQSGPKEPIPSLEVEDLQNQAPEPDADAEQRRVSRVKDEPFPSDEALADDNQEAEPSYDFQSVTETEPTDKCLYASVFEANIQDTADDYCRERDRRILRRAEIDLLLGTLGILNVDDTLEIEDVQEFTDNQLAMQGITQITFLPMDGGCVIQAEGVRAATTNILVEEVLQEETVVFNGCASPYIEFPDEPSVHGLSVYTAPLAREDCHLCVNPDTHYQFRTRHSRADVKHSLIHDDIEARNVGRVCENVFNIDMTLTASTYGRVYNFLPSAEDINSAVHFICEDDDVELPSPRLPVQEVLAVTFDMIRSASLEKLLKIFFCMKNCRYAYKGRTVRQINMCE